MTRFFTKLDADRSYASLKDVCEKMGYTWKKSCTNQVRDPRTAHNNDGKRHEKEEKRTEIVEYLKLNKILIKSRNNDGERHTD